jgi:hypothetical protein
MTDTPKDEADLNEQDRYDWEQDILSVLRCECPGRGEDEFHWHYSPINVDMLLNTILGWREQWQKEAGQKAYRGLLDEALNSGNGTYKP